METRKSSPDKKEIRKKHLAIRDAMSEPETAEKSRAICEKLLTSDWYAITDWIFGYYPLGKEADCLECRRINPMDLSNTQITVLVPGVVFTPTGSRYGYGKGFYDRYFARYAKLNRFALAYENQLEPELEVLDTDIKMHRIYTETGEYDII